MLNSKMTRLVVACMAAAAPMLAQANQRLADLIEAGNRKAALERIRAGADVNEAQPDGTRPIHWAVYRVDYELIESLIAKKAKLSVGNEFGASPISEAAKLADARMVKMLLDGGAEPEGANADGQTALMLAVKAGELAIVEMLINAGANVKVVEKFRNQTPLMWAASAPKNAAEITRLLLAKGADLKPRALFNDWESQITSEPRAQYKPTGGLTALLYAARNGCLGCVEALLGAGADINYPTPEGMTPLLLAIDNDHNDVAKLLLERGANPHVWDWYGRTALYIAVDRKAASAPAAGRGNARGARGAAPAGPVQVSSMELINMLIDRGVDLDAQLVMHRPSRGGNSGRFIDPLMNLGCTPLLRAILSSDIEVARVLLAKGASPNINAMGITPFALAAGVGTGNKPGATGLAAQAAVGGPPNMPMMDLLLAHGADINAQITGTLTYSMRVTRAPSANEGMTALHYAALNGRPELVRYLLGKGARMDLLDAEGRKPIEMLTAPRPINPANPVGPIPAAAAAEIRAALTAK